MYMIRYLLKYLETKRKENGEKYPLWEDLPKLILFLLAAANGIVVSFCGFLLKNTAPDFYIVGNSTEWGFVGFSVFIILFFIAVVFVITSYLFTRFSKIILDDAFFPKRCKKVSI